MNELPSVEREEWRHLLTGELEVSLENFILQMKVTNTKNRISRKEITIDNAVLEVFNLCKKFYSAKNMSKDIDKIFKIDRNSEILIEDSNKKDNNNSSNNVDFTDELNKLKEDFQKEIKGVKEVSFNFLKTEFDKLYKEKELSQKMNDETFLKIRKNINILNDRLLKSENLNQRLLLMNDDLKSKIEENRGFFSKMFNS